MREYVHGGGFGDIVYSIPAFRESGAERYLLSRQFGGGGNNYTPEPMVSLLESQGIRVGVLNAKGIVRAGKDWINGDSFRNVRIGGSYFYGQRPPTIVERHFCAIQRPVDFCVLPWLRVRPIFKARVVLIRSCRYRPEVCKVDWAWFARNLANDVLFVGTRYEHHQFCKDFFVDPPGWEPSDFLAAAQVIAGADLVVHNQTGLGAVACGLGVTRILEVCERGDDCQLLWPSEFAGSDQWIEQFRATGIFPKQRQSGFSVVGELGQNLQSAAR